MAREYVTKHNGVTHFTFQQQIGGIDIWGAEMKANVTADGALVNISSTMLPRPDGGFATPPSTFDASDALAAAAADAGVTIEQLLRPATSPEGPELKQVWEETRAAESWPKAPERTWRRPTRTQLDI